MCWARDKPEAKGYVVEAGPAGEKLASMSGQVTKTNPELVCLSIRKHCGGTAHPRST